MPGFDGTGPFGQGPMTGRGLGFCVLTASEENPDQIQGFVGIDGKPIGKVNESFKFPRKEVINMPFGDGTGPAGLGPMTGRAAGFCAGYPMPGYMNPVMGGAGFYAPTFGPYGAGSYGYGAGYGVPYAGWANPWLRRGFGFGRGFGRGRGWGRGFGRGRGQGLGRFAYWW
jgi:hypothetical protein